MADDSRLKIWGRWVFWTLIVLVVVVPWPLIAWGRAQRSASAPAVLEDVLPHGNGRFTVGAFSFSVNGDVYTARMQARRHDVASERGLGSTWKGCTFATTRNGLARTLP